MSTWTPEAEQALGAYLDRVAHLCREKGDDAEDVLADLRDHIVTEVERAGETEVDGERLRAVLARLGTPEQVAGVEPSGGDKGLWGIVDAVLRDREPLYAHLLSQQSLRRLCGKLTLIFILAVGAYGLAMGSFRCVHPQYYFSDYELMVPGRGPIRGKVAGMVAETNTVYVCETTLPAGEQAAGATVRFNVTDPSESYPVKELAKEKGFGRIVLADTEVLEEEGAWRLPIYVAIKAPSLFLLTLILCLPALYVLNLTFGLQLRLGPTITLMLFALAATGVMLAVFVPIVALFSIVTESYHFTKLMHVLVFAIAGFFGVKVLWEGLARMARSRAVRTRPLFAAWLLLYCLVGGQITWTLKPWIGTPYLPATPPFRIEGGNIYVSAFRSYQQMMQGRGPRSEEASD